MKELLDLYSLLKNKQGTDYPQGAAAAAGGAD